MKMDAQFLILELCAFSIIEYDFKALVRMDKEISLKDRLERVEAVLQEVNIFFLTQVISRFVILFRF